MIVFFEDLRRGVQQQIIEELKKKLMPRVLEAVEFGVDKATAEKEIVSHFLNTHNFGYEWKY